MSESRSYPDRIYAGHLGGGRRTWKPELFDATERAHSCEYVRQDIASEILGALRIAEQEFEAIRKILERNLEEPERSAFWVAVRSRDQARAALAKAGIKP